MLPFSLWDSCQWASVPVIAIVAFLMLGVKEIGVQIEEPFTILPLEVICNTIETNVSPAPSERQPATLWLAMLSLPGRRPHRCPFLLHALATIAGVGASPRALYGGRGCSAGGGAPACLVAG